MEDDTEKAVIKSVTQNPEKLRVWYFLTYGLLVLGCLACRREASGGVADNVLLLVGLIVGDAFKLSGVGLESLGAGHKLHLVHHLLAVGGGYGQ